MKVFLIIVGILAIILLLPVGAKANYDENGIVLRMVLGLIQIPILPKKKPKTQKAEKTGQEEGKTKKEKSSEKALRKKIKPKVKKPIGEKIETFLPLVPSAVEALGALRWVFFIHCLTFEISYGGSDAGKICENYGKACAMMGPAIGLLKNNLHIGKVKVHAEPSFEHQEILIRANAIITVTLGGLIVYLIRYGVPILKMLLKIKLKEKAVTENESSSS